MEACDGCDPRGVFGLGLGLGWTPRMMEDSGFGGMVGLVDGRLGLDFGLDLGGPHCLQGGCDAGLGSGSGWDEASVDDLNLQLVH